MHLSKEKKRKLRRVLGAMSPSIKGDLMMQDMVYDMKDLERTIEELRTEFSKELESKISSIPENTDLTEEISILRDEFETKFEILAENELEVINIKEQLPVLVENTIDKEKEIREEFNKRMDEIVKNLRNDFNSRIANLGGGSMNQKISINSSVMSSKYADINLLGSITKSDNDTTKQVDITIADADTGITQLTGDVTAGPGSGSQVATLATVNGNVGTFGSATQSPQVTVNVKGLVTAASNVTITPAFGSVTGGTAGSVIFSNGTNLAQDNDNFLWDATNKRLGIGTNAPATLFHARIKI